MTRETTLPAWAPGIGMSALDDSSNYIGERIKAYVVYSKHRDSDLLTQTNFDGILADLESAAEKAGAPDSVEVHSFGHWGVGHVDQIMITPDAPDSVFDCAEEALARLADYPVYNESEYSDAEWNAAADYWESLSPRKKVEHAMRERKERHWTAKESVWRFGRLSFSDLANEGSTIGEALYERVRSYATE